jgi:hypothetical protein
MTTIEIVQIGTGFYLSSSDDAYLPDVATSRCYATLEEAAADAAAMNAEYAHFAALAGAR